MKNTVEGYILTGDFKSYGAVISDIKAEVT